MYCIGLGAEVVVPNSQVVPISQVVLKTGSTVYLPDGRVRRVTGCCATASFWCHSQHSFVALLCLCTAGVCST